VAFATALALGLGTFVVLPWLAHRLRRSPPREERFAPLRFVPEASGPSDVPRRIDDRALFLVRALVVLLLAVLAAGPRLRTTSLRFHEGEGDAALVLVLDDSGSMRTREGGTTRLEAGKRALLRVIDDLDGGDRVALVLAGKPARVARGFTADLEAVRAAIAAVGTSDRTTDLEGALEQAEALVGTDAESQGVVVVATDGEVAGVGRVLETRLPLHRLAVPVARRDDCAVLAATASSGVARARVACQVASRRTISWVVADRTLASTEVDLPTGVSEHALEGASAKAEGFVELDARDAIREDDRAAVTVASARTRVAVLERTVAVDDEERTPPTLVRAFEAVAPEAEVVRLVRVPTDGSLEAFDVLAVDNASAWTADERTSLQRAVESGLSLWVAFGPASAEAPLGASFEPFVEGPVAWESGTFDVRVVDGSMPAVRGRARFAASSASHAEVTTTFADGVALALRASSPESEVTLFAVPADPRFGDLALRPSFVEEVAALVDRARRLRPHGALHAGDRLRVPREAAVSGPGGVVALVREGTSAFADVDRVGSYRIASGGREQLRQATLDESEVLGAPAVLRSRAASIEPRSVLRDRSPWVVALLAAALALELTLRFRLRPRRGQPS
jgi:von Willebrand factor type A domain/Aerotolerance regulator N-terminal